MKTKKMYSFVIHFVIFTLLMTNFVFAANDAQDLYYETVINIANTKGEAITSVAVGERVVVEVVLKQKGTGTAPLYGMQGELIFDPYCLQYLDGTELNGANITIRNDRIAFAFLDLSGNGIALESTMKICKLQFEACNDGTVDFLLENFLLTNKDATTRDVDSSSDSELKIGSGIKAPTREALLSSITAALSNLHEAVVSDVKVNLIYPAFSVTTSAANEYQRRIEEAQKVYNDVNSSATQISSAITLLSLATSAFELEKNYGTRRSRSSSNVQVTVRAIAGENGSIVEKYKIQKVAKGTSVTIISMPNHGYDTEYVYVNGVRFAGKDTFTIPRVDKDTEVKVAFCEKVVYADVKPDDWYYEGVRYATNHELFKGMGDNLFMPAEAMTRGMMVTVLHRIAGKPTATKQSDLSDVQRDSWYTDAVDWAVEAGIMTGMGDGSFGTELPIAREQLATVLYRYTKSTEVFDISTLQNYNDTNEISDWATKAMTWAYSKGLIQGITTDQLAPKESTTRAQMATVLMRFCENND